MFIGIAINLTGRLMASASPASLFANGEPGAWFDPSDIKTLFQDNAGTTPVTAAGQTVGLMLDKSQGLVLGPELVTNGNFSDGTTGWTAVNSTLSVVEGSIVVTKTGGYASAVQSLLGLTVGAAYRLTCSFSNPNGLNAYLGFGGFFNAAQSTATNGVLQCTLFATATSHSVQVGLWADSGSVGQSVSFDNISVKLLAGNHATQATSTQRPIYGINPIVGTRNLLTYTEQFDNAAWAGGYSANTTKTVNTAIAPDGSMTADTLTATASVARTTQNISLTGGATYTFSVWLKRKTGSGAIAIGTNVENGTLTNVESLINTSTWTRVSFSGVPRAITGTAYPIIQIGTSGDELYAWGAQLELGSTATAYQKVVSQYEVTQAGVQSVSYLAFDGVDDGMVTNTITPGIDKVQVFAGVRKLSDAAQAVIAEFSSTAGNPGAFSLQGPGPGAVQLRFASGGSIPPSNVAVDIVSGNAAPITRVLSGTGDILADNVVMRINGVQAGQNTADQGTGNYLAYPLYIGRRGGTTLPFNGRLYSLITRFGPNLTTGQITATESWVNGETGAY